MGLSVLLCSRPAILQQSWKFPPPRKWITMSIHSHLQSTPKCLNFIPSSFFISSIILEEAKWSVENRDLRDKHVERLHVRKYLYWVLWSGCGLAPYRIQDWKTFSLRVEGTAPTGTWPMLLLRSSVDSKSF